jgi:hypothetical protein
LASEDWLNGTRIFFPVELLFRKKQACAILAFANHHPMNALTNRNKEVCSYLGIFGILISLTCLGQILFFGRESVGLLIFILVYIFSVVAYSLLTAHNTASPILLIVNASLVFILTMLTIIGGLFSPVLILLMIYSAIVTIVIHIDGLPAKFRRNLMAKRAEEEVWRGKI